MARFCTHCGASNDADAAFCESCGQPLARPAASSAPPPAPPPDGATARAPRRGLLIGGIIAVVAVAIIAVVLALTLGSGATPSGGQAKKLAQQWLDQHRDALMAGACLANFNYGQNPVDVASWDTSTQQWLATLVAAGVYSTPQKVQSGYTPMLRYAYGPSAVQYIRNGQLCLARGVDIAKTELLTGKQALEAAQVPPSVRVGDALLAKVADIKITLAWQGVPAWANAPIVQQQWMQLPNQMEHTVMLYHRKDAGWTLATPEDQQRWAQELATAVMNPDSASEFSALSGALKAMNPYQQYVAQSQVSEGLSLADGAETAIAEFYSNYGRFPSGNASAGLASATSISGNYVTSVDVGVQPGTIQITYGNKARRMIAGRTLVLAATVADGSITWTCQGPSSGAGGIPRSLWPSDCH